MKIILLFQNKFFPIFIFTIFLLSCAGIGEGLLQSPDLKITNVKVTNLSLSNQNLVFTLGIHNPNPVPIPIKGLTYRLDLNGAEFANGFNESDITIPASGSGEIDLKIGGNLISIIQKSGGIPKDGIDYRLSGDIALLSSSLRFPYSRDGKLSINTLF